MTAQSLPIECHEACWSHLLTMSQLEYANCEHGRQRRWKGEGWSVEWAIPAAGLGCWGPATVDGACHLSDDSPVFQLSAIVTA